MDLFEQPAGGFFQHLLETAVLPSVWIGKSSPGVVARIQIQTALRLVQLIIELPHIDNIKSKDSTRTPRGIGIRYLPTLSTEN